MENQQQFEQPQIKQFEQIQIKQFGLQRTGTNYLRVLLEYNYNVQILTNIGGWKHGFYNVPQIMKKELDCIVMCKNPFSWLVSLHSFYTNKYKIILSFSDFIKEEFIMQGTDIFPSSGKLDFRVPYKIRYINPVECWNNMMFHWLNIFLYSHKIKFIQYEKLLEQPEKISKQIAKEFKLQSITENFVNIKEEVLPSKDKVKRFGKEFEKTNYYLENKFMEKFTESDYEFVENNLDYDIVRFLGYDKI